MLQVVLHAAQPMCHAILQTCCCDTRSCCAQATYRHWNVQPAMPSRCTRHLIDLVLQLQLQLPVVGMTSHSSTPRANNNTLSPNRNHVVLLSIICDGICLEHTTWHLAIALSFLKRQAQLCYQAAAQVSWQSLSSMLMAAAHSTIRSQTLRSI
jgi:hypothetical protein